MHLPTAIFMSSSLCGVCKMSVTLAWQGNTQGNTWHKLPRILSALLVFTGVLTVFTSFLIIFLLNIYLFVKNTLSSKV